MSESDARRLRLADGDYADDLSRVPAEFPAGAPSVVCTVAGGSAAGTFCAVTPQRVTGTEEAGAAGVFADDGGGFVALHLGDADPSGKTVVCTYVPYRWVFNG